MGSTHCELKDLRSSCCISFPRGVDGRAEQKGLHGDPSLWRRLQVHNQLIFTWKPVFALCPPTHQVSPTACGLTAISTHDDDTTFTNCELCCRHFGPAFRFPCNNFLKIILGLGLSTITGRASTRTPTVMGTSDFLAITYNINNKSDSSNMVAVVVMPR